MLTFLENKNKTKTKTNTIRLFPRGFSAFIYNSRITYRTKEVIKQSKYEWIFRLLKIFRG